MRTYSSYTNLKSHNEQKEKQRKRQEKKKGNGIRRGDTVSPPSAALCRVTAGREPLLLNLTLFNAIRRREGDTETPPLSARTARPAPRRCRGTDEVPLQST
ncbi:hypothetical protein EVAR_48422_1 [Eumeta japonica]|uniref:Uncharacterized protein n=1 Tax=Eumeta variegata TaxID=151549 RepID=A0A4C1XU52_EUMVA|nr:hypothetical protein EVAR_48422_1 [Eumeta japonica]